MSGAAEEVLAAAWRDAWGRLLALLVAQYRRLDLAEDGLADAFEAAARTWPVAGVPDNPPAWLLTAARRRVLDRLRAEAEAARRLPVLAVEAELQQQAQRVLADDGETVVDERLRLVLLCASPRSPPRRPPPSRCAWCWVCRPRTWPGCSSSAPRRWPPG